MNKLELENAVNCDRSTFLLPETRCDFLVTCERKKLWKSLLDIVEVVVRIFDKHNIRYILDGGSLLGAIRHGGIIPWDDDVDITVLREDYNKLEMLFKQELPPNLFFQTSKTDSEYDITHIKIRDGSKSAIAPYHTCDGRRYNMGVFVDIFPVDGVAPNEKLQKKQLRDLRLVKAIYTLALRRQCSNLKQRIASCVGRVVYSLIGSKRLYEMREKIMARYSSGEFEWGQLAIGEWGYKKALARRREWLINVKTVPFEYLNLKVPIDAEAQLTHQYGDWKKFVKGTGLHGGIDFDMDKDYKTKLIEEYGYKPEDFKS